VGNKEVVYNEGRGIYRDLEGGLGKAGRVDAEFFSVNILILEVH